MTLEELRNQIDVLFFGRRKDRRGNNVRFPLMSLSLAIVTESPRITSYQSIGEVAAELKSFAKRQAGSFVAMDKRKR